MQSAPSTRKGKPIPKKKYQSSINFLEWIVVPHINKNPLQAIQSISSLLHKTIPQYVVFLDIVGPPNGNAFYISSRAYEIIASDNRNIILNPISSKQIDSILKGKNNPNMWIIFHEPNQLGPYQIKKAFINFIKASIMETEKTNPLSLNQTKLDQEVSHSISQYLFSEINTSPNNNILFISDQFPPLNNIFNVKTYQDFGREDLVLAPHFTMIFENQKPVEVKRSIKSLILQKLQADPTFVITSNISEILDVIISHFYINITASPSLGKILLIGPPGTGKTTIAKKLSKVLFDTEELFSRVDMNTFAGKEGSREMLSLYLLGATGEYRNSHVGRGPIMKLWLYRRGIILWDEIDKVGDPATLNLLMQILEEDEIETIQGGKVPIHNLIHIFTANKVVNYKKKIGLTSSHSETEMYINSIKEILPEPFLSRIDKIIYIGYPTKEELFKMTDKLVKSALEEWVLKKSKKFKHELRNYIFNKIEKTLKNKKDKTATGITPRMLKQWMKEYIQQL